MTSPNGPRLALAALMLLGLSASAAEAAGASPSRPVTIRGTTAAAAPSDGDGSTIVLRGSTPPPSPPAAVYVCPPGYADIAGAGCVPPDNGSYADQSDYDGDWLPYDFGNGRRAFRPRRHVFVRSMHGVAHSSGSGRR